MAYFGKINPFVWILLLGGILRLAAAFTSIGYDDHHEVYRLWEPLAYLKGYFAHLPLEWRIQILSSLPARAHSFLLSGVEFLGIRSPLSQLLVLRILYGMISVFQIVAAWSLVKRVSKNDKLALTAAGFVAFWPELIFRSVRLMDYSLEASFLAIALLFTYGLKKSGKSLQYDGLAGILLGALFFVRFQSGLYFIALLFLIVWESKFEFRSPILLKRLTCFSFAYGATIFVFAALEPGVSFMGPFLGYLKFNVVENKAAEIFGGDPWHRYVSESAKFLGLLAFPALVILAIRTERSRKVFFVWFFVIIIHSLISHKEARFVYAVHWLLFPAAAIGACSIHWSRQRLIGYSLILILGISVFINLERVSRRYFHRVDGVRSLAQIGEEIGRLGEKGTPIKIRESGLHYPAGFLLRHRAPFCHEAKHNGYLPCSERKLPSRHLVISRLNDSAAGIKTLASFGKWKLSLSVPQ